MDLLTIAIVIILVGVILWAINTYLPMQPNVKKILNVVVIIILIIWLLQAFGVFGHLHNVRI